MIYWHCLNCDASDRGPVIGDPEQMKEDGWEKQEIKL